MTTSVSSKGQIVIPKAVRDRRSIKTGDDFEVITPEGSADIILRKVQTQPNKRLVSALRKLRGLKIPSRSREAGRDLAL